MIRPWYRSLGFWLGLPGALFLLWGWFANPLLYGSLRITLGEYCLTLSDDGRSAEIDWEIYGQGRLMAPRVHFHRFIAGGTWILSQPEQQLFPYRVQEYYYHLGTRSIPELRIAYWFLLLLYLSAWTVLYAGWQRRQARLLELPARRPAFLRWDRAWIPLLLWAGLISVVADSVDRRTRGWLGGGKFHLGWSHTRGLLTATLFHEVYAPGGVDFQWGMVREEWSGERSSTAGWTSRRWPKVIGGGQAFPYWWELRFPTIPLVQIFPMLWLAGTCWRWHRRKVRTVKLPVTSSAPPS
ncbi:hypothetical protein OKA05_05290 [Luteolibacter arcticus]|uniref:Uncharacterized protein n=1 Tax=Luteolibacter arcticus TaxID=1581411 RepID=A0ABT3GEB8_9BACT|nr:hypothetical protein [Luteolibacter arcticus]MCW1921956.1 hypothetical protein [Luteolibacter arcticus]